MKKARKLVTIIELITWTTLNPWNNNEEPYGDGCLEILLSLIIVPPLSFSYVSKSFLYKQSPSIGSKTMSSAQDPSRPLSIVQAFLGVSGLQR
jgi:hypothetical protein